ncbi:unnamed protein product, partial [Oncorhynchus mykiss]
MGADCVVSSCSLSVPPGLHELLCALPSQLQPHVHSQDDSTFLHNMFGERSLHSLVKIHERLQHYEELSPAPILDSAGSLAADVSSSPSP